MGRNVRRGDDFFRDGKKSRRNTVKLLKSHRAFCAFLPMPPSRGHELKHVPLRDIPNYYLIDWKMIGTYDFRDCVILIDEASIDINNRFFHNMALSTIKYLKLHRHYRAQMYFFSQSHDDVDVTVRRLSDKYYLVSKSIFFPITRKFILRLIRKQVGINDDKLICDSFDFVPLSKFKFSGRRVFPHFDSFDAPKLPSQLSPVPEFHKGEKRSK